MHASQDPVFPLAALLEAQTAGGRAYHEFLRAPSGSLSAGLYRLAAGAHDPQQPHSQDEVYYVVAGRAHLRVGEMRYELQPGTTAFVPAGAPHRFEDVQTELTLLVFFAPAETVVVNGAPEPGA